MAVQKIQKFGLKDREIAFADEYRKCREATAAYCKIYSTPSKKITRKAAKSCAHRLLKKPEVQAYIDRLDDETSEAAQVTVKKIITGIARGAFWDAKNLFDPETGQYKPIHEIDDDTRLAITGFHGARPIMMDKSKNLEMLGKIKRLFVDRQELTGSDGLPISFDGEIRVNVEFVEPQK